MKRLLNIFVILLTIFLWYNNNDALKMNGSCHSVSSTVINKSLNEKPPVVNSGNILSDSAIEKPDLIKKKLVKGIEQASFSVSDASSFREAIKENKPLFFSQTSYSSILFSGNGKRGPPFIYPVI